MEKPMIAIVKQRIYTFLIPALFMVLADGAYAHHGWSWYNGTEESTLTGIVSGTDFRNPHDRIMLRVDNEEWDILFGPPSRNRRAGLGPDSVHVGDEVTIYGHRHAEPGRLEMKTERIKVGDAMFNLYPERE
jgi:hypothetical protein